MSKDTHFIDTEVEESPMNSWDDYETYCENGERVLNAICDEAALYKIASETIKKKLDSLNEYGKYYKRQFDRVMDENKNLQDKVSDLESVLNESKKDIEKVKLEASKELYENYLRTQNPLGVIVNDKFYVVHKVWEDVECPYCDGTSVIKTQTDQELECPKCNNGKRSEHTGYEIEEKTCSLVKKYGYPDKIYFSYYDGDDSYSKYEESDEDNFYHKAFKTKEEAEQAISKMNRK